MPELPEVEVTRQGLLPRLPGRRVTKIFYSGKLLRAAIPEKELGAHILGATFATVDRRAKYLLFRMTGGAVMVMHLGMTGKLGLLPEREPPALHDHLRIRLDNGLELRYNDSRRFGCILVWPPPEADRLEAAFSSLLGVEPLSNDFSVSYLQQKSRSRKTVVKNFLMDSRIVAGVGNIYANEILFDAAVHPESRVSELVPDQWMAIISATRRILRKAIRSGGSTISDFLGASGNPGYFQIHFKVYGRAGEKCLACGEIIIKKVTGGRATFFCPHCQKASAE